MLETRFILEHPKEVQTNCDHRGVKIDVAEFFQLEKTRRQHQADVEQLSRQANLVSKSIGQTQDHPERERHKAEGRRLREKKEALQEKIDLLTMKAERILRKIPNMTHPEAPVGPEAASRKICFGKTEVPRFSFPPLDHVELAAKHDLVDFEGGGRVAGHGFYFLKNESVLLELALQRYALDLLIAHDFVPTITPDLARTEILQGIGFIPRGPETQIYSVENSDLNLVATAEITLGGLFLGQVLDREKLPLKFCGISHCFRTEAGAAGRASRGLYRVHQFTKVEMFAFTLPEQSESMLDNFCGLECQLFDGLEIPYRVIDTASGDLGGPAYRKFDLEAWMPGRGKQGAYGEVTSASNCTDYQARRLGIRFKTPGKKGTKFVHTLNGTAIAISRALIAILENHQQPDGSIMIPKVLQPYLGLERIEGNSDRPLDRRET